jgi:flavodoxin
MRTLVVKDSQLGNTAQVAKAIGEVLSSNTQVEVLQVNDVGPGNLEGIELLIVGSPTQRFSPTTGTTSFLKQLPANSLRGAKTATFDTRFTVEEIEKTSILASFVRIFGYAAKPIAKRMRQKGGEEVFPPEGFYVDGLEGPLLQGEIKRARDWVIQIIDSVS